MLLLAISLARAGAGSGDVLFLSADYEHQVNANTVNLVAVKLGFEDGGAGISAINMTAALSRAEVQALQGAASNGAAAFDTAMASTSQAAWYASVVAAANTAGLTGPRRPENLIRRCFLNVLKDYSP